MDKKITDEELVKLSKNNDENAENLLLERYKDLVVKIARGYYIIGGELEDIVQEGMIGLYKAIKGFSDDKSASFKTFAILCIKRQIQSAIKKANTKKNLPLSNSISLQSFSDKTDENEFLPVDLYKSTVNKFTVEKDGIRPPFSALTGFGEVDAKKLVEAREKYEKFSSIEDMTIKSKIGKVAVETLKQSGCLDGMPKSEQMDIFDML